VPDHKYREDADIVIKFEKKRRGNYFLYQGRDRRHAKSLGIVRLGKKYKVPAKDGAIVVF
jgi:hypothetical protein